MSIVFAPGARTDIVEARGWWMENRPEAPQLLVTELEDAFRTLPEIARALPLYRRVGALEVRRHHVPRVHRHIYFHFASEDIVVLAVWGAVRGLLPKLRARAAAGR